MPELIIENIDFLSQLLTDIQSAEQLFDYRVSSDIKHVVNHTYTFYQEAFNKSSFMDFQLLSNNQISLNRSMIQCSSNILKNFQVIQINAKAKNKEESCDFNMLRLFHIGETRHSILLANILNPNSEHGQENLFLLNFLLKIGIECPDKGQWIVTAEKGRIDVLLKRVHPHSVVVIENKSNLAVDQTHQLYRYWHQEIFYPNRHRSMDYTGQHPEKYQIIYLTPADWKQPTSNSLMKPSDWPSNLPDPLPIVPMIWKFDKEISEWLNSSLQEIPYGNYRLKEYIKQYIEFWK